MMVFVALLLPTILGFLIVSLVLGFAGDRETSFLERLCLSYPLGAGLLTMQIFILGLLRAPLTLAYTSVPLAIEIAALTLWSLQKNVSLIPSMSLGFLKEISSPETAIWRKVALILLTIWAGTKIASIFAETGLRIITAEDAWTHWSARAKLFYYTKGLMLDVSAVDFFTGGIVGGNVSYPLHNPLMQTWISLWNGSFDEVLVKFWSPVYLVTVSVYLYTVAARSLGRLTGMALVVLFMSSPLMSYHSTEVYSDFTLGCYLFFASASFLHAMRGRKGFWFLMGIFSAQSLFIKREALFYVLPLVVSAIAFIRSSAEQSSIKRSHLYSLSLPFLVMLPWYVFRVYYGLGLGPIGIYNAVGFDLGGVGANRVGTGLAFHPEVFTQVLSSLMSLDNYGVFLVFFPILVLFGWRQSKEMRHLLFAFFNYALFFAMLYLFTGVHLYIDQGTIIYRNILTAYPVLGMLTALLLKELIPIVAKDKQNMEKKKNFLRVTLDMEKA
jgi:hypothetical protein